VGGYREDLNYFKGAVKILVVRETGSKKNQKEDVESEVPDYHGPVVNKRPPLRRAKHRAGVKDCVKIWVVIKKGRHRS